MVVLRGSQHWRPREAGWRRALLTAPFGRCSKQFPSNLEAAGLKELLIEARNINYNWSY